MKHITFAFGIFLCMAVALGAAEDSSRIESRDALNATEILSLLENSSNELKSYRFELEMDQRMEIFNLSSLNRSSQVILVRSLGIGSLNMTDKAFRMVIASLIVPLGDEINATAAAVEEYLIEDALYMKVDGDWTRTNMTIPDLWAEQDRAGQQLKLLNQSQIIAAGIETVDGEPCYKIKLQPNMTAYSEIISSMDRILGSLKLSEIYSSSTKDIAYWISKDALQLKKTSISMSMMLTPESLGVLPIGPEKQEMHLETNTTMLFQEYNSAVNIALPSQAMDAKMESISK